MVLRFKKPRLRILFALVDGVGEAAWRAVAWRPFWRRGEPPASPRRIVVVRLDHVGDVLLSTPAVRALRRRFPQAHVTALVGPWARGVLTNADFLDDVQCFAAPWFDRGRGSGGALRALLVEALRLRAQRFDLGIDLRGDLRNVALLAVAGVPFRVGYGDAGGRFLLNRPVPRVKHQHEVERSLDVVRSLGADLPLAQRSPRFAVSSTAHEACERALREAGVDLTAPLVVVHPGAGVPSKLWPAASFATVGDELVRRHGAAVVLTGTGGERPLVESIIAGMQTSAVDLTGVLSLEELGALLARARLLVTVDSAPMHLAAALGTPVAAAFSGITTLSQWAPYGAAPEGIVQKPVPCLGCELTECPWPTNCMNLITPADLLAAAERVWRQTRAWPISLPATPPSQWGD